MQPPFPPAPCSGIFRERSLKHCHWTASCWYLERARHQAPREDRVFLPTGGLSQRQTDDDKTIGCQDKSDREGFISLHSSPTFSSSGSLCIFAVFHFASPSLGPTRARCCTSPITRGSILRANCHCNHCWMSIAFVTWIPPIFSIWEKGRKANKALWNTVNLAWWKGA